MSIYFHLKKKNLSYLVVIRLFNRIEKMQIRFWSDREYEIKIWVKKKVKVEFFFRVILDNAKCCRDGQKAADQFCLIHLF